MMIRLTAFLVGLCFLMPGVVTATGGVFESCRSLEPPEKTSCVEDAVAASPLDRGILRELQLLVASDADTALKAATLLLRQHATTLAEQPVSKAALLDLEGQALFALGRFKDSAAAFEASLALDSGVTRLTWLAAEGATGWSAEIDVGAGRLERAARSLLHAERSAEAAVLMDRAVLLGGSDWTEEERSALAASGADLAPRSRATLVAPPWFLPIPDFEIGLLGKDETIALEDLRGNVVVLDFWATWCGPCKDELPHLQKLYLEEHERGLTALAINVQEPVQLAMPFARALGLTMPIGQYNTQLDEVFKVNKLPSLVVIDRQGRARGRWDGYQWGVERAVAELARDLLAGGSDPPARDVARVIEGEGLLEIAWLRELSARADGVRIVPTSSTEMKILVTSGRKLLLHEPDSRTARTWRDLPLTGRLAISQTGPDGMYRGVVYRQGSDSLVSMALPDGEFERFSAPSPVFDAVWVGPSTADSNSAGLVIGSRDGLLRRDAEGGFRPTEGFGVVSNVTAWDGGLVVLEAGGRLSWLDRELNVVTRRSGPSDGWILVEDPRSSGVGVAPPNVTATATGRFLEGGSLQAALATRSGQLLLIDLSDGRVRYRAVWGSPIADVAAGDLDGDGFDELVVATGPDLGVLRRPAATQN
jgi:thiol-disulfide isomerase/thioredoxin